MINFYTKCFYVFYKISTVCFIIRKEEKDIFKSNTPNIIKHDPVSSHEIPPVPQLSHAVSWLLFLPSPLPSVAIKTFFTLYHPCTYPLYLSSSISFVQQKPLRLKIFLKERVYWAIRCQRTRFWGVQSEAPAAGLDGEGKRVHHPRVDRALLYRAFGEEVCKLLWKDLHWL